MLQIIYTEAGETKRACDACRSCDVEAKGIQTVDGRDTYGDQAPGG